MELIKSLFPSIPGDVFEAIERGEHEATKSWSFVMVKKQVFELLVSEIGKRVPYGSKLNLYDDTYQAVLKSRNSKYYLRSRDLMKYWNKSFQLDNYVKTLLFIDAVDAMRKLWFPQAGAGSQANERYLYHAVGKLVEEIYQQEKDVLLKEYQEHPEWFDKNISLPDYQHGAETVYHSRLKYLER